MILFCIIFFSFVFFFASIYQREAKVKQYPSARAYLKELHANDGENELQKTGDEDYVSDSLYRYDDALYYVLWLQHYN